MFGLLYDRRQKEGGISSSHLILGSREMSSSMYYAAVVTNKCIIFISCSTSPTATEC